ncbi:hypothetical protein [Glutamicibacter sp.]|jgi:hypothetical protein|uniref:hypothetical protein n=1 Tax=Glutamicibacter sp. TaxID=1931995 RepID=UPI002B480FFF|nr:hypothetical protein [Glutamicibacter sp.]HJX77107.1 hypothetical protein [Glutamicibacter sp.]
MMLFDKLGESARPAPPRKAALLFAALTAVLLLASAALQLRASAARWIDFGSTVGPHELSVESDQYDYYLPYGEFFPLANTGFPLGIAMILQALALLCLLAALGALRERTSRAVLFTALLLGVLAALGFALQGLHALLSALERQPSALLDSQLFSLALLIGFLALCALSILCFFSIPLLGLAAAFLLGSTLVGYYLSSYLLTALLTGYVSHDTTPGTETTVALSTAAASITMLAALISLACQRRK